MLTVVFCVVLWCIAVLCKWRHNKVAFNPITILPSRVLTKPHLIVYPVDLKHIGCKRHAEVIRPILDSLVELLPEYGFTKTSDKYAMYGEYYRIKAGIVLIGGSSINDDFGLVFTPLFHGQPCGESAEVIVTSWSLLFAVK